MAVKRILFFKEKIFKIFRKSLFLCQIYVFLVRFKDLCRYGKMDPPVFILNHDKKIAYVRIAKVANSSIKVSMCEQNLEGVKEYYKIHEMVSSTNVLNQSEENFYKFSFVRNPYERLVSCYTNKYITDKKHLEKRDHLYMDTYLFGYIRNPKDFTDFVRKICKIPTCLEDRHFQKQYNVLYDKQGNCIVDYIGKFENLQEDFEVLRDKFDLKELPHYNPTEKGNWMDFYTIETAKLVYEKYEKDIKTFGYEDTYKALMKYLKQKEVKSV